MERPLKRQRVALEPLGTDDDDELDCEPNELNQRRDPVYQLEQARTRASDKLKSRFESIFAKYEKDFTGIGDEIDLRTGKVVVNNGHLQSITGIQEFGEGTEDEKEDAHCPENDFQVRGTSDGAFGDGSSDMVAQGNHPMAVVPNADTPPAHQSFMPPSQPVGPWEMGRTQAVDPAWRTPELPQSAFMSTRFISQAQQRTFGTGQVTRVTRGPLTRTRGQDGDEEDVLLDATDNRLAAKESPLIKSKFPAVGSSPNNDPGLHEMIQDVIGNIAAESPSGEQSRRRASGTKQSSRPGTKPAAPEADSHCLQGKGKTSGLYSLSTSTSAAVSPSRGEEAPHGSNKERVRAVTMRKGRRPKAPTEKRIATGGPGASGMEEDFLDITGHTPLKPAGQTFYVEIKARKVGQTDLSAQDHGDHELETVDRSSLGVDSSDRTLGPPLRSRTLGVDEPAEPAEPPSGTRVVELTTNRLGPGMMRSGTEGGLSQRKTLDPASASTGADKLPTTKENGVPASTEFGSQALQDLKPSVPQKPPEEQFKRNIVDSSYTFSDEENLLPRRRSTIRHKSELPCPAGLTVQGASRVNKKTKAGKFPPTIVSPDSSIQEKRYLAARTSPQPVVERDAAARATEASNASQEPSSDHLLDYSPSAGPMSSSHRRTRRKGPKKAGSEQLGQQATAEAEPRSVRDRSQNRPGNDLQRHPGLRREPSLVEASLPAAANDDVTSAKPPKTAEAAPGAPSTPRPKYKSRPEKAGASTPGLISLLSDDDDEEDEISYNFADFTPSGHHRILGLRPDTKPPSTAGTGKNNRRRASLLFGPASSSKASKHSTPGCDDKDSKWRRRSTNTFTGSVVRIGHGSPRAPSPAESVVQTPGGTKRRCGEDGFRCEKGFCFACISI